MSDLHSVCAPRALCKLSQAMFVQIFTNLTGLWAATPARRNRLEFAGNRPLQTCLLLSGRLLGWRRRNIAGSRFERGDERSIRGIPDPHFPIEAAGRQALRGVVVGQ